MPFFETIGVKERDQYSRFDLHQVPHGICFMQSLFAGRYYLNKTIRAHHTHLFQLNHTNLNTLQEHQTILTYATLSEDPDLVSQWRSVRKLYTRVIQTTK